MTNFKLKLIAISTMFIDHLGLMLYVNIVDEMVIWYHPWAIYMRFIGRVAFPIFAFLTAQGCLYTRDIKKYAMRLGLFALISQVPYAMVKQDDLLEGINIFGTLMLSVLLIWGYQQFFEGRVLIKKIMYGLFFTGALWLAYYVQVDYGYKGVLGIFILYLVTKYSKRRLYTMLALVGMLFAIYGDSIFLLYGLISLVPIGLYNHKLGKKLRWVFYGFYPGHLLFLVVLRLVIMRNFY